MLPSCILKRTVAVAALASAFAVFPALGQEDDQAAVRLPAVVTTAQKIEENAQDVPISITTLSDEKLDNLRAGGSDIRFLSARVPSVIAESSFGRAFPRFYIRGIGNTDFDLNASQPVSLVYDDVPYESPILKGYPVFDLAGIEVLRGPQGTLFGRNTPGGIIKFDSVKPGEDLNGYARVTYGEHNLTEVEGAFGARPDETFAFRISGLVQRRDSFVDNAFTGESDAYEGFEEAAGRIQGLWSPAATTDILLNLHARQNDGSSRLFRANIIDFGTSGLNDGFDFDTVFFDAENYLEQSAAGVTLRIEHELSDSLDMTYVFGRETASVDSRGDIDGGFGAAFLGQGNFGPGNIPFPVETSGAVDKLVQTTHEARIAYDGDGKLRAQAGVFVFSEAVDITSKNFNSFAPGNPQSGPAAQRSLETDSLGVFASLSYDLTDRLTVAGGARWTDDEKSFTAAGDQRELGDEQVSWDVSTVFAVTEDFNLYAKAAKGFRGPTVQQRFGAPSQADSETILSYEVGAKSEFFDNRVRLNTSAYLFDYEGQQLTIVGGQANNVSLFNAEESEGYGFEADLEAAPIANLLLTAGLSYNKTEFLDDIILAEGCGLGGTLCTILDPAVYSVAGVITQVAPGAPPPVGGTRLGYNISGNSFPNAPEWIGNFTARYAIPFAGGELYAFTDWAYKGDTNFFLYESVEFGQDGYWQGGLRTGWVSDNGLEASVFVRNLTDEIVLEGGIDFNNLTGFVNEPRTWGVELAYRF